MKDLLKSRLRKIKIQEVILDNQEVLKNFNTEAEVKA